MTLKEKAKIKGFIRKHKTHIIAGATIVLAAGTAYVICKTRADTAARIKALEADGEKILQTLGPAIVIEGSGPIWGKIKELFDSVYMTPEDVWMVEVIDGKKTISHISSRPELEQAEI